MKQHTSSRQPSRRKQNASSRSSGKQSKHMPERGAKIRARQRMACKKFGRKTNLQILHQKRLNAVHTSLEFSEVSIQTLHSICTPVAQHKQVNNSHFQNIRSGQSIFQQDELKRSPLSLLSSFKQTSFCASDACSSRESRLIKAVEEANASPSPSNDASKELWLEVSVEIDHGIDLVVDLNLDRSTTGWLDWERNSCMLVPPDKAVDDMQTRCSSDQANKSADAACDASGSSEEAPSTKHIGALDDDQFTTTNGQFTTTNGILLDGGSGTDMSAQMCFLATCVPVESQQNSTLGTEEPRHEGFSLASLERMPTFLATGLAEPFERKRKANTKSDWMVVCIEV